jgi:hypothetical protein
MTKRPYGVHICADVPDYLLAPLHRHTARPLGRHVYISSSYLAVVETRAPEAETLKYKHRGSAVGSR